MRKYSDYKKDKTQEDLNQNELNNIKWVKYKIIVPTNDDRKELMDAFEDIHYTPVDTDIIAVNQLIHEYLDETHGNYTNNIIVDEELYNKLNKK